MVKGFLLGTGFTIAIVLLQSVASSNDWYRQLSSKLMTAASMLSVNAQADYAALTTPPSTVLKRFTSPQTEVPSDFLVLRVTDTTEFLNAIKQANARGGKTAIFLEEGRYRLKRSVIISSPHIMLMSSSGNPYNTIIEGAGMMHTAAVKNVLEVRAAHFVLDGLTLEKTPNHLIQIGGENQANYPIIRNCILQDGYEQLLKVSYDQAKRPTHFSDAGIVEHCIFQYTQGIAPYYYTGGVDALGAKNWRVQNNVFRDIASPNKHIAQHGVHFWVNSSNNTVRDNIFIDNDRAIGFGMKLQVHSESMLDYYSKGGEIMGNFIYHSDNDHPFADVGIILESSPGTLVRSNMIMMQHDYPNAIEYRFTETQGAIIANNQTNKAIVSRDGGKAALKDNSQDIDSLAFFTALNQHKEALGILDLHAPINKVGQP